MSEFDYSTLEWISSQSGLDNPTPSHSLSKVAIGFEILDRSPVKAGFFWKRDGELVWGIELSREELVEVISHLEHKKIDVPPAFRDALQKFTTFYKLETIAISQPHVTG